MGLSLDSGAWVPDLPDIGVENLLVRLCYTGYIIIIPDIVLPGQVTPPLHPRAPELLPLQLQDRHVANPVGPELS